MNFKKILLSASLLLLVAGCATFPTGYKGIVTTGWGQISGEVKDPGMYGVIPFTGYEIHNMNVQTQSLELKGINGATSDRQVLHMDVVMNYHLDPDPKKLTHVWATLRNDYEPRVVGHTAIQSIKDAAAPFSSTNVQARRAELTVKIEKDIQGRLNPYGIVVEQANVPNLDFDKGYQDSIEETAKAQQAQKTAIINAQTELDKARIQNQTTIANAKAEALSQGAKRVSLTPAILQQAWIDKWDGHVPMVTGGNNVLNAQDLMKITAAQQKSDDK